MAIAITVAWMLVGFLLLIASLLARYPARDEYDAAVEDLSALGQKLNGSRVLAEMYIRIAKYLWYAHTFFSIFWFLNFAVGLGGLLIPPVETTQGGLRASMLSSGLILAELCAAMVEGILLLITFAMRETRKDWKRAVVLDGALQQKDSERLDKRIENAERNIEE